MNELPDTVHERVQALCAEGDKLAGQDRFEEALGRYWSAWKLLPEPRTDWEAASWILAPIGDANFFRGDFAAGRDALMTAMRSEAATGNPFLRLRLGQCLFELGELPEAANWLAGAYLMEGKKVFRRQTAEIAAAKQVIYDGFKAALAAGVPKDKAGILVDEQFGSSILRDARANGYAAACPAEKSGQDEFDFEYGADFAKHIEAVQPTFCKVLVRYNPAGDTALNQRQTARLKQLSDYLHSNSQSRFMFELLVPAEKAQLDRVKGDKKAYDLELRPKLMVQTIQELQDAGVEPDVWKIEGLDRRADCEKIVAVARRGDRDKVGCIILGRGEDDKKVHEWLTTAAGVRGFIGFAVGRTAFWEPLVDFRAKKIAREAAVAEIARLYEEFVGIFEKARP